MKNPTFNINKVKTALILNCLELLVNDETGFTIDFNGEKVSPTKGYFVSNYAPSLEMPFFEKLNEGAIHEFLVRGTISKVLTKDSFIGVWINQDKIYFDYSELIQNKSQAVQFGLNNHQKAIFDCENNKVVYLDKYKL